MDTSSWLKQSMEDYSQLTQSLDDYDIAEMFLRINEARHSQKRSSETCPEDGEHDSRSAEHGINNGVVPNQTNVVTEQASQPTNVSSSTLLKRKYPILTAAERADRKRINDRTYRQKIKSAKAEMQVSLWALSEENESLKKENESLKMDNAMMNGTLRDQEKEIDRLRNDLLQLKREHEKQNVLVQTLSGFLSDPVRLETEKLKEENALLRKNANLNNSLLAEENAKLRTENKVLKVQNDALCGKIISDNDKKCEQKQ